MAEDNFDDVAAYNSYLADCVLRQEEDREDKDDWAENYAETNGVDVKRVKAVAEIGIYAGERNEFNERHGKGEAKYPNGDVYTGDFAATFRHGTGVYIHAPFSYEPTPFVTALRKRWHAAPEPRNLGALAIEAAAALRTSPEHVAAIFDVVTRTGCDFRPCYSGHWESGAQHGQGVQLLRDGTLVHGEFKGGRRDGHCTVWYPNGDCYVGSLTASVRDGDGTYKYSAWTFSQGGAAAGAAKEAPCSGGSLRGTWAAGRLVSGDVTFTDGTLWRGPCNAKSQPEGDGCVLYQPSGLRQEGNVTKGVWRPKGLPVVPLAASADAAA